MKNKEKKEKKKMYLQSHRKVTQLKLNNCLYAIYLTFVISIMIGDVLCSDSNSAQKKTQLSGSGSESLQKRSSFAVISQAMQETISDNEFESE